jgi:hypothetical protein
MKTPPEGSGGVHHLALSNIDQHLPPCIAFSVQLAAEFTSAAAPRTVLHAATARHAPTNTNAATF